MISSYGTGKATINSDTLCGAYIYNLAGFVIKNLIFTGVNRTTNKNAGIIVYLDKDSTTLSFIKIDSVEVFGYRNAGISIGSWDTASRINNISITHSISHDNGSAGISIFGIQPYLHRNVYIGYNKVYNNSGIPEQSSNSGSGIVLGSADVATIEYCTSYNNGWLHTTTTTGGPAGIWTYNSDSVTIQKNESHHNKTGTTKDGSGFDIDGGCTNSILQYNYSHDNYGGGLVIAQASGAPTMKNITVRYNISENDGRKNDYGGIHLWSSGSNGGIQTANIYNNTVYVTPSSGAYPKAFFIRSGGMSGVKVRNNILQTKGGVELVRVPYSNCTMQGNSYWSSGSTFKIIWGSTAYSSLTVWRTASGQEYVNGTASGLQADAQFADTTTGTTFSSASQITDLKRYKLKSTSLLINKGLNLKALFGTSIGNRDFWGNSLVNKTSFNIGAFQGTPISQTTTLAYDSTYVLHAPVDVQQLQNSLTLVSGTGQQGVTFSITLIKQQKVTVDLYNMQGQLIRTIFTGEVDAGAYKQLQVETADLQNGVYILSVHGNSIFMSKKFLVSK